MDRTQTGGQSILPDGCVIGGPSLPMPWPPPMWPPEEPDPQPDDLAEPIDWMSFSHEELHAMVHQGLDLGAAVQVAGSWGELGDNLEEIGSDLRKALGESAEGWQGAAAETARGTMQRLADWTGDTATRGKDVSVCVSRQAELAENARNQMPEPVGLDVIRPLPMPQPVPEPVPTTSLSSGGYASAPGIVADPVPEQERARQAHQDAAEVMRRLQNDSLEVHRDVPSFVSPTARTLGTPDDPPPEEDRDDRDSGRDEPDDGRTSTSSTVGGGVSGEPAGVPRGAGGAGVPGSGTPATTGAQQPGSDAPRYGAAPRSGNAVPSAPAAAGGVSGSSATGGASRGAMGGMPMGAGAGARPGEDSEHKVAEYLEEDSDFWAPTAPVTPPVIGAEPPNGGRSSGSGS